MFPLLHPLLFLPLHSSIPRILNPLLLPLMKTRKILLSRFRVKRDLLYLFHLSSLRGRRHIRRIWNLWSRSKNILKSREVKASRRTELAERTPRPHASRSTCIIFPLRCYQRLVNSLIAVTNMLLPRLGALLFAASYAHALKDTSPFFLVSSDPFVFHSLGSASVHLLMSSQSSR